MEQSWPIGDVAERRCSSVDMRPVASGAAPQRAAALSGTTQQCAEKGPFIIQDDMPMPYSITSIMVERPESPVRQSVGRYLACAAPTVAAQVPTSHPSNFLPTNIAV